MDSRPCCFDGSPPCQPDQVTRRRFVQSIGAAAAVVSASPFVSLAKGGETKRQPETLVKKLYDSLSQKAAVLGLAAYVTRILLAHDEDHALRSLHQLILRITRARERKRPQRTNPRRSFRPVPRWGPNGRRGA